MSKFKTPREKKLASLALDGRSVYGENTKSSRKGIPLRKKLGHQLLRRATLPLTAITSMERFDEDDLVAVEAQVKASEVKATQARFRKRPDEPLGIVLDAKRSGDHTKLTRKRK